MTSEAQFQKELIKKLQIMFPRAFILKNDPSQNQGIPDLLILIGPHWAMLEVKKSETEHRQPNQNWYIDRLNAESFAAFVYPENEEEVLHGLQESFGAFR